jgi:hypothetical protein
LAAIPLQRIAAREATEEEIVSIHSADHFAFVRSTQGMLLSLTPTLTYRDLRT